MSLETIQEEVVGLREDVQEMGDNVLALATVAGQKVQIFDDKIQEVKDLIDEAGSGGSPNAVRYDIAQSLTDAQQIRAATNMGVGNVGDDLVAAWEAGAESDASGVVVLPGEQIPGPQGIPGKSAYEVWLAAGNTGSMSVYLASLKGEKGDKGDPGGGSGGTGTPGPKGDKGDPGVDGRNGINGVSTGAGASVAENVTYVPMAGINRSLSDKLKETRSVFDFGVIGKRNDAAYSHPIRDYYPTLQEARDVFGNFITSLDDEMDWAGMQAAFNWMDENRAPIDMGDAQVMLNRPLVYRGAYFHLKGSGARFFGDLRDSNPFRQIFEDLPAIPAPILTYPTEDHHGPLAGSMIIFERLIYYPVFEGLNFNNMRFGISFLQSPNSPIFRECNFYEGNCGVFYYTGCQNPKYYNCGSGNLGVFHISSATAFPSDSPHTVNDNYFTDNLTWENAYGYNSCSVQVQPKFDAWFVQSVLRPNVVSYGSVPAGEKYVDENGQVYADDSFYSCPTGRVIFVPFRHPRVCFALYIRSPDTRGATFRSFALVNTYIFVVELSNYSNEGALSYEPKPPGWTPHYLVCGSVESGFIAETGRLDYIDGNSQEILENGRGQQSGGAVPGTRLFHIGTSAKVIQGKKYTGLIKGKFYENETVNPVTYGEVSNRQPSEANGPAAYEVNRVGHYASDVLHETLIEGVPAFFDLPTIVGGVVKSNAVIYQGGYSGYLDIMVRNMNTGEEDACRVWVDRYENQALTLAAAAVNGDKVVLVTGQPNGGFEMAQGALWRFDGVAAGFTCGRFEGNGIINVAGRLTGIPGGQRPAGTTISRVEALKVITPFKRGWVSVVNGANGGNQMPGFGYNGNLGLLNNLQVQGDGLTKDLLRVTIIASQIARATDMLYMAAPPTTGRWVRGTRIYNSAPTAGGYEGWVNVSTDPIAAVWKGFGLIQA